MEHLKTHTLAFLAAAPCLASGQQVLHYSETSGFDHNTRAVSEQFFTDIGNSLGFTVVNDNDGSQFDQWGDLLQFDVIVFSNTSGNALLSAQQQANFMAYVDSGGSVLGIHAATDTYRHGTANGSNTGTWDYYAELMGASVQENPNHVNGTPAYDLSHITPHPSTAALPEPWTKNEEFYYWENGYFRPDNVVVLEVEETIGPNGLVNSYDVARAMSWCRELPHGGRVFCTALGHGAGNFTSDPLFREHIAGAMGWLLQGPSAVHGTTMPLLVAEEGCLPVPTNWTTVRVLDGQGCLVAVHATRGQVCLGDARSKPGLYVLVGNTPTSTATIRVLVPPAY